MTAYRIPFNKPAVVGDELRYIAEATRSGHLSGDGPFARRCCELLERLVGAERALLTPSCTHALEIAALLLELQPGDEVIVPSFAFVTTANAFVLHGATPVFADVAPDTLNLDPDRVRERVGARTRAIVALHYGGVACEMDALRKVADEAGAALLEDNAHGLLGAYRGRPLGGLGSAAAQSFHETKNLTSGGEGGALLVHEPGWVRRAEILREKGTDRSRFFRGEVDKYTWVDIGSSYLPSEIQAAYLWAQLEARERIQERRAHLWRRYEAGLRDWATSHGVGLPAVPAHCTQTHHLFRLMLPGEASRAALIEQLRARGILAVFHYLPLHLSAMGRRFGGRAGDCPVTEDASERLLRLPLYHDLSDAEQDEVLEAVVGFVP